MVLWVFGYGSLIWKVGFSYDERVVGFIKGYKRAFSQGNTDHRGTPEFPGRTVTLEPHDGAVCWGVAYRISGYEKERLVLSYLELREKEYDIRTHVEFFTEASADVPAISGVLVYIASSNKSSNKFYLGPAPVKEMAYQIAIAVGPSGTNTEYLFQLHDALREIGHEDKEINNLVEEVREVIKANTNSRNFNCCIFPEENVQSKTNEVVRPLSKFLY